MITKEIRIAKTLRCKESKSSYSKCHDCIQPSLLSQLRTGDTAAGAQQYKYISFRAEFFFWRPSWWEKSTSEKITVISAEYISGNFITHLKSIIHMYAWHLISINCWKWGSGVTKINFFFPLAFLLYLLTQIFHNIWKGKQLIWDWEDMEKATSSWDTLGTAFNGLARGRFLYVWVHTGSMQPILILDR